MSRQVAMGRRRTARTISRRTLGTLTALAAAVLVVVLIASEVNHAVSKLGLPLSNAEVIRTQAADLFATEDLQNAVKTFLEHGGPGHATFEGR